MSDAIGAPVDATIPMVPPAVPDASAAPPAPVDDGVVFTIGGHAFTVPVPTLADAKLAPGRWLSSEQVEAAEKAIDLVLASCGITVGKDALMQGCSIGEALALGEALRQLYTRAGLPADFQPLA